MANARKILIVDDDTDLRDTLVEQLSLHDEFEASAVDTGAKGASAAKTDSPDLVLMDVRMPEMTGLEAASQLMRELPDVIVILTSAFEVQGIWRASQESGAFAFVMKEHLTQELPRLLEVAGSTKGWNGPTQNCA